MLHTFIANNSSKYYKGIADNRLEHYKCIANNRSEYIRRVLLVTLQDIFSWNSWQVDKVWIIITSVIPPTVNNSISEKEINAIKLKLESLLALLGLLVYYNKRLTTLVIGIFFKKLDVKGQLRRPILIYYITLTHY